MRIALLMTLSVCCTHLYAGLEPFDEALLQRYVKGDAVLPGVLPTGYEHKFEVGDLQEVEVLDRGVTRTLRFHIVGNVGDEVICEAHNGRGLVFAGLMNDKGEFSKAWAGRSGERPTEVKHRANQHNQQLLHEALGVPFSPELYKLAAVEYREADKFKLGSGDLTVTWAAYSYGGVRYELLRSHGADAWFGPHWQWSAEGTVIYRVTRREKMAAAQPLLDWSKVDAKIPQPIAPPEWTAPKDDWTVQQRADGSALCFTWQARAEYQFLDATLGTIAGRPRIGVYGKSVVDASSPGPLIVPPGCTLQLNMPGDADWVELDLLLQQAAKLPVSMVVATGLACTDRGLKALKAFPVLQALDIYTLTNEITSQGYKSIAGMARLVDLAFTLGPGDVAAAMAPLKDLKTVRKLALRAPNLKGVPEAIQGWTKLESFEITGKDIAGVGKLTGLTALSIAHSEVTRKAADEVPTLANLRRLEIHSTDLPIPVIKKLTQLEWLTITADEPEEPSFQIEAAATLKNLLTLVLAVKEMKGQDILPLAGSAIETLEISEGLDEPGDVSKLAMLSSLKNLRLEKLKGLDASSLADLVELKKLKNLTLAGPVLGRPRGPSEVLTALAAFTQLEELHLLDCGLVKLGAIGLDKFAGLRALTLDSLNLDAAVLEELSRCKKLESLSLAGSLLAKGSHEKLAAIKSLKRMDLRRNMSILPADLQTLRAALPDCEVLK